MSSICFADSCAKFAVRAGALRGTFERVNFLYSNTSHVFKIVSGFYISHFDRLRGGCG